MEFIALQLSPIENFPELSALGSSLDLKWMLLHKLRRFSTIEPMHGPLFFLVLTMRD